MGNGRISLDSTVHRGTVDGKVTMKTNAAHRIPARSAGLAIAALTATLALAGCGKSAPAAADTGSPVATTATVASSATLDTAQPTSPAPSLPSTAAPVSTSSGPGAAPTNPPATVTKTAATKTAATKTTVTTAASGSESLFPNATRANLLTGGDYLNFGFSAATVSEVFEGDPLALECTPSMVAAYAPGYRALVARLVTGKQTAGYEYVVTFRTEASAKAFYDKYRQVLDGCTTFTHYRPVGTITAGRTDRGTFWYGKQLALSGPGGRVYGAALAHNRVALVLLSSPTSDPTKTTVVPGLLGRALERMAPLS